MKRGIQLAVALGIALATPAFAQKAADDHAAHHARAPVPAAAPTQGEVRKVDRAARRITIKHGPIPNIDMPAMTMVFQVKDPKMLDQLKAGDRIKFTADKVGEAYTVTSIQR